jgi:hypothetical protein
MNFASRGKVTIRLRKNEIGGPLDPWQSNVHWIATVWNECKGSCPTWKKKRVQEMHVLSRTCVTCWAPWLIRLPEAWSIFQDPPRELSDAARELVT